MEIRIPDDGVKIFVNGVEYSPTPTPASSAIEEREGRDWEILALSDTNGTVVKGENIVYIPPHASIHSVLRKSDGVVFTVNDRVEDKLCKGEKNIKSFSVDSDTNDLLVWFDGHARILKMITKLPQRTKLFTTEDGVDVFEGDGYYFISHWDICDTRENQNWVGSTPVVAFADKEKAKEYITLNKPVLSVNDLNTLLPNLYHDDLLKIKDLAKKKLNIEG